MKLIILVIQMLVKMKTFDYYYYYYLSKIG